MAWRSTSRQSVQRWRDLMRKKAAPAPTISRPSECYTHLVFRAEISSLV
jgi:hypothetical protein